MCRPHVGAAARAQAAAREHVERLILAHDERRLVPLAHAFPEPVHARHRTDEAANARMPAGLDGKRIDGRIVVRGENELGAEVDDPRHGVARIAAEHDVVRRAGAVAALEHPLEKHVFVGAARDVRDRLAPREPRDGFEQHGPYESGWTNEGLDVGVLLPPSGSTVSATAASDVALTGS